MPPTLAWSGTFHGIGARLLREYANAIGLDPAFTIHDREDSADLMNLVRHEKGLSHTEKRFPTKATCLAIYSRTVNQEAELADVLQHAFPWCGGWQEELSGLFRAYTEAKQSQNVLDYDDLLLYLAAMLEEKAIAEDIGARFDHILIDEYQDTNRLQASILMALRPDGRGVVVVGDDAQSIYSFRAATVRNILDFPKSFSPPAAVVTLARNYRSTQAILAASNAVISLAEERYAKELWSERKSGDRPALVVTADEADQARYVVERVLANREGGVALKEQAVLFRAAHHSGQLEIELTRRNIPFVKFGGLKFLDAAHVKDVLALLRFAGNPRDRVSGFRVLQLLPGIGPSSAADVLDRLAQADAASAVLAAYQPPARAAADWPGFAGLADRAQRRPGGLAGGDGARAAVVRAASGAHPRGCPNPPQRRHAARTDRRRLSEPRALPDRTDARPAGCDQRRGRAAVSRRGLSDPLHHPFGQGTGVEIGVRAQRHRRLHPLRSRGGHERGDRGRAAAALCRHDAGEGRTRHPGAAALLCAAAAARRRPPPLRPAHALHPRGDPALFPRQPVAAGRGRERAAGKGRGPTHRRRRAPQAALGLTDGAATPNFCLMRAFAALLDRLVLTPQRSVKLRLMTDYFRETPDPDRGFALAALTGELDIPSVKPAMLRAMVTARVDEVLFAYSYDYVGDLAETIALIWPARGRTCTPHPVRLGSRTLGEAKPTLIPARGEGEDARGGYPSPLSALPAPQRDG